MALPSPATKHEIRVLIVDDSAFMRRAMERLIEKMPGVCVVGTAVDGVEGLKRALELRPDVITMDVEMPKMDGVCTVREIMQTLPTPIVMVSTLTSAGADTTMRALEAGAVEAIAKPSGLSHELANVSEKLAEAIQRASFAHVHRRRPAPVLMPRPASPPPATGGRTSNQLIVIGSSTGGPPALTEVVPHLPADLNAGVLIVQHMPAGFTGALARRLDSLSPLTVAEAVDGELIVPGRALIAPGDFHMVVTRDKRVRLDKGPSVHGVRPSVDITLKSVAEVYGGSNVAVAILTGMGKDGAEGAAIIERAGGKVITQDEATCVVYGMPRVTKEMTQHANELPLERIADALARALPGLRGTR